MQPTPLTRANLETNLPYISYTQSLNLSASFYLMRPLESVAGLPLIRSKPIQSCARFLCFDWNLKHAIDDIGVVIEIDGTKRSVAWRMLRFGHGILQ